MADSILINGKIHDWSDVKITLGSGGEYTGITSVNWSSRKDKSLQYAAGTAPHGIGYGHRSCSVDFTLTLESAAKFEAIAHDAGKDALDYAPFLIVIAYSDKIVGAEGMIGEAWDVIKKIEIHDVDVTDISESLDEGTQKIVRRYTAVAGKILAKA